VPDDLYRRAKAEAALHRRKLNDLIETPCNPFSETYAKMSQAFAKQANAFGSCFFEARFTRLLNSWSVQGADAK